MDFTEKPEEDNHALFFGSLIPPKGIEFLIQAVPKIKQKIPDFTLTIAGNGNIPDGCSGILNEFSDCITIRNEFIPNDEVGELFSKAKVVILPYRKGWQTGHSGTLSTAFAFGKPVVTSAVGDFPELVEKSGAGVVVEPENPQAVANGVVDVLVEESRRKTMAENSARVAEELSWDNIGRRHLALYQKLLSNN
jgi:glycosyltransferase involved in cell wall biosynthesis